VVSGTSNRLSWALDSSLSYRTDQTTLIISYDHLVTGGSGVLVGAQTGQAEATVERKLSPRWQGSASLGYAKNRSLLPATTSLGKQQYDSWYAAVRFNRQLRPGTAFFVSYGARRQVMNAPACATPSCGTSSIGHEVSAGFNFGLRPVLFR